MATWSFRDALEELEVRRQFDESMLQSDVGLRLGDIRFAEIQTSIKMCAVQFSTFLHYIEDRSFNPDNLLLIAVVKLRPYFLLSSQTGTSKTLRVLELAA